MVWRFYSFILLYLEGRIKQNRIELDMLDTIKLKSEVIALAADTRLWHSKRDREFADLDRTQFVEVMKTKYEYLFANSATLFERAMQGDLNMQQFDYMLEMIDKVNRGADYHETSVEVGKKLVDIYVKPMIDKKN
jgi:hypothetical protein